MSYRSRTWAASAGVLGPDEEVCWPAYSDQIDFELELGIVIGRAGRNITPERARDHILGLTVLNDFSARDIQFQEMGARLGPSKGKHFASAVGPRIVTLDGLDPAALAMRARVNGEPWAEGSSGSILWSIEELVAWASTGENLPAGALLGTGTVGGGSDWSSIATSRWATSSSSRSTGSGCCATGSGGTPTAAGGRSRGRRRPTLLYARSPPCRLPAVAGPPHAAPCSRSSRWSSPPRSL